ncbi:unnamed protein product [Polarella glacialis]|uniref:Uncharacterized protein n=1 Tax=Polarella glacialis TaxID=89957 RepID=A0A813L370_POLGL|nr:unnamed protein product [Polarella glacialis]CAE8716818.1 unnamed protein product [Polarella glacialis]|mmetsp:Transcript_100407/g.181216  ORF Transcript_100407/g.181216 Transcript_100407/m.181216 type:complete len:301 (-) Transcript_100407:9-911(-)
MASSSSSAGAPAGGGVWDEPTSSSQDGAVQVLSLDEGVAPATGGPSLVETDLDRPFPDATPQLGETDTAELALLSRLKGAGGGLQPSSGFEEAADLVMWALDVSQKGPSGLFEPIKSAEKRRTVDLRRSLRTLGMSVGAALIVLILLFLTRAHFTEATARDGLLLATGVPAYRGEEAVAGLAVAREFRSLGSCASLATGSLRNIRDVTLVHRGVWRCLHISRVLKYSGSHIWLEAANGAGLRVRSGQVFLRETELSDEEAVQDGGETYPPLLLANATENATAVNRISPTAFFDVVFSQSA